MKVWLPAWLLVATLAAGCGAAPTVPATLSTSANPSTPSNPSNPSNPSTPSATPATFAGLTVAEQALPAGPNLPDPDSATLPFLQERWRGAVATRVAVINKTLAPFGYKVTFVEDPNVGHPTYTVNHGDTVVVSTADFIGTPSVNSRGDDFLLLVERGAQNQVLSRDKSEGWDMPAHGFIAPVYAGDRLVTVVDESGPSRTTAEPLHYSVLSGSEKLFSEQMRWERVDAPIKGLTGWDGHWVLEVGGRVIIDGKPLGADKGYTELFGWQVLAGKPFYYAVKDGKTSIIYGDQVFPTQYEAVVHYRCCSAGAFNNGGNGQMAWFFGKRDGRWYYVELSKHD